MQLRPTFSQFSIQTALLSHHHNKDIIPNLIFYQINSLIFFRNSTFLVTILLYILYTFSCHYDERFRI